MQIVTKVKDIQIIVDGLRAEGKKIAVVPTMGYLHEGHCSLFTKGKELADLVITTLFVNPTQFAPNEDFEKYPRDFERDKGLAESYGCDYLFNPDVSEMYPMGNNTEINIKNISKKFEGVTRPTHFNGVATVVSKLFLSTKPHYAIFGQKDYQQTLVVKQLVRDMLFDVTIVVAPTVRESDGLAKSSRNVYLNAEARMNATILFKAMDEAIKAIENGERKRKIINAIMHNTLRSVQGIRLDYASSADAFNLDEPEEFVPGQQIVLLIAVYLDKTRLIDNAVVSIPSAISSNPKNFIEGMGK